MLSAGRLKAALAVHVTSINFSRLRIHLTRLQTAAHTALGATWIANGRLIEQGSECGAGDDCTQLYQGSLRKQAPRCRPSAPEPYYDATRSSTWTEDRASASLPNQVLGCCW